MSIWKAIKGLFGSAANSPKVLETAADGIYNGIDKLFYTAEEQADDNIKNAEAKRAALAKAQDVFLSFAASNIEQNSIRAITRRWLTFVVVGPAMTCFISAGIAGLSAVYTTDIILAIKHKEAATLLFDLFKEIAPWAGGILIFYFGPHLINALPRSKNNA